MIAVGIVTAAGDNAVKWRHYVAKRRSSMTTWVADRHHHQQQQQSTVIASLYPSLSPYVYTLRHAYDVFNIIRLYR